MQFIAKIGVLIIWCFFGFLKIGRLELVAQSLNCNNAFKATAVQNDRAGIIETQGSHSK